MNAKTVTLTVGNTFNHTHAGKQNQSYLWREGNKINHTNGGKEGKKDTKHFSLQEKKLTIPMDYWDRNGIEITGMGMLLTSGYIVGI